jgi:ribulose-5-phosphate 4-epimerase/fuculose-1-phosphate aldolase
LEEGQRILASAGNKPVLLLRNHGPVVLGFNLANALALMWLVNRACEVQLASQSMGKTRAIAVPVLEGCVRDSLNFNPKFGGGQDAFDALQRIVDRIDPSYRG